MKSNNRSLSHHCHYERTPSRRGVQSADASRQKRRDSRRDSLAHHLPLIGVSRRPLSRLQADLGLRSLPDDWSEYRHERNAHHHPGSTGRQNRLKRLRIAAREVLRSAKRPCSRRCVLLLSRPSPRRFRRPLVTYLTLPHLAFASPCSVSLRSARTNSLLLLGGSVCRVLNPRWRTIPRTHRKWAGDKGNKASTGKNSAKEGSQNLRICLAGRLRRLQSEQVLPPRKLKQSLPPAHPPFSRSAPPPRGPWTLDLGIHGIVKGSAEMGVDSLYRRESPFFHFAPASPHAGWRWMQRH
ncbi:hypothetical protein K456DRAFT_935254 [Colletotrichum gloeosporioides 23]|nr:hypothetical protein K456DRAFT_935254 [Colletotrichum gloeosporioides 23]